MTAAPPCPRTAAVRLASAHARTADGLLIGEPGRDLVLCGDPAAPAGAAGVIRAGRTGLIPGGPLAAGEDVPALLAAVDAACEARGLAPLWLNVTTAELPALRAAGFAPTRTGADCLVRHPGDWGGGQFRAVRAACGRADRAGVRVRELSPDPLAGWYELPTLFAAHLAAKPQRRPATAFVAPVPGPGNAARRVWVAAAGGRAVGFATAHPLGARGADGARRWTLGGFHTHPDAPTGAAARLVRGVLDDLRAAGVTAVSLGPAPALPCGTAPDGENPLVAAAVRAWFRAGNGLFDARGLWHFKSRFRPDLEPLHACGRPRVSAAAAWAFVRASGVLRADPRAVLRGAWRDLRRPAAFGAVPPARGFTVPDA